VSLPYKISSHSLLPCPTWRFLTTLKIWYTVLLWFAHFQYHSWAIHVVSKFMRTVITYWTSTYSKVEIWSFVESVTRSSLGARVKKLLMVDYLNLDSHESSRVSEIQEDTAGDPVVLWNSIYNSEQRLMSSSSTNLHYVTVMGYSSTVGMMDLSNNWMGLKRTVHGWCVQ
jgi:hypothetical protein